MKAELRFPDEFDDYYAREVEDKGVFVRAIACRGEQEVAVTFFDPVRLAQEIEQDLSSGRPFVEVRLIVVERVTRENMAAAVERLGPEFFA